MVHHVQRSAVATRPRDLQIGWALPNEWTKLVVSRRPAGWAACLRQDRVVSAQQVNVGLGGMRQRWQRPSAAAAQIGDRQRQAEIGGQSHVAALAVDLPMGVRGRILPAARRAFAWPEEEDAAGPQAEMKEREGFFWASGWK